MVTESIKQYSAYLANQRKPSTESLTADFNIEHPVIQESESFIPKYETDSLYQKSSSLNPKSEDTNHSFINARNELSNKVPINFTKIDSFEKSYSVQSIVHKDINIAKAETGFNEKINTVTVDEITSIPNQLKSQKTHTPLKVCIAPI